MENKFQKVFEWLFYLKPGKFIVNRTAKIAPNYFNFSSLILSIVSTPFILVCTKKFNYCCSSFNCK